MKLEALKRLQETQFSFDVRIKDGTSYGASTKRVDAKNLEAAWKMVVKDLGPLLPFLVSVTLKETK